jgi:hypothetical protein
MSKNCNCKKCCGKTVCCETTTVCYEQQCVNPCLLLNEPCNPCPPQVKTVCFPSPYDPCNPCPCPPYPCPPYPPCPPKNDSLCPQYIVNNKVIVDDVTLTSQQVNNYNYFVCNPSSSSPEMTVTLPAISTLNNQGRKNIYLVNLSGFSITVVPGGSDSLNGLGVVNIDANKTLILSSLPLVSTGATWSVNGD